jgi:hypothetical protein
VKPTLDHINELQALAEMQKAKAEEVIAQCEKVRKSLNLPEQKRRDLIGTQAALRRKHLLDNKKYVQ